MRANLELTGGALLAERVTTELTADLGRHVAHETVGRGPSPASGRSRRQPAAGIDFDKLLDPAGYLGTSEAFIDAALRRHSHRVNTEAQGLSSET